MLSGKIFCKEEHPDSDNMAQRTKAMVKVNCKNRFMVISCGGGSPNGDPRVVWISFTAGQAYVALVYVPLLSGLQM